MELKHRRKKKKNNRSQKGQLWGQPGISKTKETSGVEWPGSSASLWLAMFIQDTGLWSGCLCSQKLKSGTCIAIKKKQPPKLSGTYTSAVLSFSSLLKKQNKQNTQKKQNTCLPS